MNFFNLLLTIHIICGSISLALGLYVLVFRKGNKNHRRIGNVYFYAMLTASVVALPMSYIHPNYFLFIIGVFTSYMLLTGKRYLKNKTTADVRPLDWLLSCIMLVFGFGFIFFGAYNVIKNNSFGVVFLVFGVISLLFVYQDWINLKGKSKVRNAYLTTHLQRMIGSYIASVTAFLVVNNTVLPAIVAWLLPTAFLVPLIVAWTKKFKQEKKAYGI